VSDFLLDSHTFVVLLIFIVSFYEHLLFYFPTL